MDSDGDLDGAGSATWDHDIFWWENTAGNGTVWATHAVEFAFDQAANIYAADMDQDGDMDVLGAANFDSDISWWENTAGNATLWTERSVDLNFDRANSVYAVDMEGDGHLDILGAATTSGEIAWWKIPLEMLPPGQNTAW